MTDGVAGERSVRSVLAAVAVSTACVLPVFLVGALAVQIRADLRFDEAALGLAPAVFFGVGAVASAAAGRFVERVGPAKGIRLAALLAAAATAGIAGVARSWPVVLAFLALGGAGNALAQPGSNLLLARTVRSGRQGTAFGIKQSAIPASMLLGGIAVPALALTVGWRFAFAAGSAGALATAALVPPATGPVASRARSARPRHVLPLALLAAGAGLGAASANTLGTFLVASAVDHGVGEAAAGLLFALGSAVGLSIRLTSGIVADRRGRPDEFLVVAGMLAVGACGYALLASGSLPLLVPAVAVAFGFGWGWPALFNLSVVARHREAPGAATGLTQTGVYTGAVSGPLVFGLLVERFSYAVAWSGSLACSLLAATSVVVAARFLDGRDRRSAVTPPGADRRRTPSEDPPPPTPASPRRG